MSYSIKLEVTPALQEQDVATYVLPRPGFHVSPVALEAATNRFFNGRHISMDELARTTKQLTELLGAPIGVKINEDTPPFVMLMLVAASLSEDEITAINDETPALFD